MPGPLDGVRVVDCSSMISGPLATALLGDQGADVIKIEAPAGGDLVRRLGRPRNGITPTFATANRNKRSVVIDLKRTAGRELLLQLIAGADVFVQNFRPGTAERMGIGEDVLRRTRPDLIYVSINGFGETGPYAAKRVYDPVIQALSGLATIQADRDSGRPRMVRLVVPDKVTAITAAQAITAALFARERGAGGQHLRLSMLDAMIAFQWAEGMTAHTFIDQEARDRPLQGLAQDLVFATADGYITAGAVSDAEWQGFTRAVERPDWLTDPRFATPRARVANAGERFTEMAQVLLTRSSADWLARFDAEEVPCAPVLTRGEVLAHPQVQANALIEQVDHPHAGRLRQARPAARFSGTPAGLRRPAPALGEHTNEVLGEHGIQQERLDSLRSGGVIA